jgi:hypothetical protein
MVNDDNPKTVFEVESGILDSGRKFRGDLQSDPLAEAGLFG